MHFFEKYYNNIIKYDLINKFNYKNLNEIPKLKKIILNFGCKTSDFKKLSIAILALQIITKKKSTVVSSKHSSVLLKIRKGEPVGCKVLLTKKFMYKFLVKLIFNIFSNIKYKIKIKKKEINTITFNFKNPLVFKELEKNYLIFNNINTMHVTFVTNTKTKKELFFLLNSFKFFQKKKLKISKIK